MKQEEENINLINRMVEKSIEAVLLAIEIYNKPTIKYRTESFSMLLCNSWELLLKAHIIKSKGLNALYEKNDKTITLKKAINKCFQSNNPIFKNLEVIINLRNNSTHYIIKELDYTMYPIFQANIHNYSNFLLKNFSISLEEKIENNFLILLQPKYREISTSDYDEKTLKKYNQIKNELKENIQKIDSNNYASKIYISFDKKSNIKIDNDSSITANIESINRLYPFTQKIAIQKINKKLQENNINYNLNQNGLTILNESYNLKTNNTFYYEIKNPNPGLTSMFRCSDALIEHIFKIIKQDPYIIDKKRKEKNASKRGE